MIIINNNNNLIQYRQFIIPSTPTNPNPISNQYISPNPTHNPINHHNPTSPIKTSAKTLQSCSDPQYPTHLNSTPSKWTIQSLIHSLSLSHLHNPNHYPLILSILSNLQLAPLFSKLPFKSSANFFNSSEADWSFD